MIITSQGFGHFTLNLNNQDFGIETSRMLLVLDGCSGAKYSEVGTRLFAQLFSRKEEFDNLEKFEDNVKSTFEEILQMMETYYPKKEDLENNFIMENLLFTIIACFKTEEGYTIKMFGDGYVISQNKRGLISYTKFNYGKCPPYYAYKYCSNLPQYKEYEFKTFEYSKNKFSRVAIATDGVLPIAKGEVIGFGNLDNYIVEGKEPLLELCIKQKRQSFSDDVTIASFDYDDGGKS